MKSVEIAINELTPHPKNSLIYGQDEDVCDLVEHIKKSGWIKPLVVSSNKTIISGHRRWKAAKLLKVEILPVEIIHFADELSELEALLLENAHREKTTEQKVREAKAWEVIEAEKARCRQKEAAITTNEKLGRQTKETVTPNLAEATKGETSECVAAKVGMKKSTYKKASKVVDRIDEERLQGKETYQALRQVLNNQSVDAAYKLITLPEIERSAIIQKLITGEAKTTTTAKRQLKLERRRNITPSETMFFESNKTKEIVPGQLVEISAPDNPTIHDRTGRVATVDGDWVEVWLRNLELQVMATYRVNVSQLTIVPISTKPELVALIARYSKLRSCNLAPIEIEILCLLERCVTLTPRELKYLEFMENQYFF